MKATEIALHLQLLDYFCIASQLSLVQVMYEMVRRVQVDTQTHPDHAHHAARWSLGRGNTPVPSGVAPPGRATAGCRA